jgi:hypothetical protein
MVVLQVMFLLEASVRVLAVIGLFGAILPMVFGMGYLLLPSYFGQTLSTPRLPGIHLVITYVAVWFLYRGVRFGIGSTYLLVGVILWGIGVAIFLGVLLWTVLPTIAVNPQLLWYSGNRPQRSTRLTIFVLPIALGYLAIGTIGLLSTVLQVPDLFEMSVPTVVHLYGAGFVALLIFALGIRLVTGFFHVTPPASLSWLVLLCGAVAPGVLATNFWHPPWFVVGASLELLAMAGYAALIALVGYRTDRRRIGLYGIGIGALGGPAAVGVAIAGVAGFFEFPFVALHVPIILNGFLIPTIVGYSYQFYPVTNGQFRGATPRTALTVILSIGVGTGIQSFGILSAVQPIQTFGVILTLTGTAGYAYLLSRRLLQ